MNIQTAVRTCLMEKPMTFEGRASRSEYWWFVLAYVIGAIVIGLLGVWTLQLLYALAMFLPAAAAGYRRLQDTGRPGTYIFVPMVLGLLGNFIPEPEMGPNGMPVSMPGAATMGFIALYGLVMLVVAVVFIWWLTRPSDPETNAYGPPPTDAA